MFLYIPTKESLFSSEIGLYQSMGIRVLSTTDERIEEISFISDVSCSDFVVNNLALLCTAGQLDPMHLMDVIEDFI